MIFLLAACARLASDGDPDDSGAAVDPGSYVVMPSLAIHGGAGVSILDAADGTELWFAPNEGVTQWLDARLAPDGSSLFVMANDMLFRDGSQSTLIELGPDGRELSRISVPDGHHAFDVFEGPDGELRFAWLQGVVHDDQDADQKVVSDRIMVQTRDGAAEPVVDVVDVLPYVDDLLVLDESPFYEGMIDWSHGNGLRWNQTRGSFTMSLGQLSAVWEVGATGSVSAVYTSTPDALDYYSLQSAWQDAPFPVYRTDFTRQHGAQIDGSGALRVLANMIDDSDPSFAAVYRVRDGVAVADFRAVSPFAMDHAVGLGGACAMPNGGTLVAWGAIGGVSALDARGETLWVHEVPAETFNPSVSSYSIAAERFLGD